VLGIEPLAQAAQNGECLGKRLARQRGLPLLERKTPRDVEDLGLKIRVLHRLRQSQRLVQSVPAFLPVPQTGQQPRLHQQRHHQHRMQVLLARLRKNLVEQALGLITLSALQVRPGQHRERLQRDRLPICLLSQQRRQSLICVLRLPAHQVSFSQVALCQTPWEPLLPLFGQCQPSSRDGVAASQ
jgi:hypothetical protein